MPFNGLKRYLKAGHIGWHNRLNSKLGSFKMFLPKQLALLLISKQNKTWMIFKFCLTVWEELPDLHLHQPDCPSSYSYAIPIGIAVTLRIFGI